MIHFREANTHDVKALSAFSEACYRDKYSEQNSAEDMALHCQTAFNEATIYEQLTHPKIATIFAEDNAQLAAYAQLHVGDAPECVSNNACGEIIRFYVDRNWHGKGLAQRLMHHCFDLLIQQNIEQAWLVVWQENPKAIAFYAKLGFQKVGEQDYVLGTDYQRDDVMAVYLNT